MLEMQKIEPDARLGQFMRLFEDVEAEFIGLAIDALIMRLDERDGDADLEPDGDDLGDRSDEFGKVARFYPDTRAADIRDAEIALATEDDEDDDPAELDDEPEDDDPPELTARNDTQNWGQPTYGTDDDEEEPDRCDAGEDMIAGGPVVDRGHWLDRNLSRCWFDLRPGSEEDAEADRPPSYRLDQTRALFLHPENDA